MCRCETVMVRARGMGVRLGVGGGGGCFSWWTLTYCKTLNLLSFYLNNFRQLLLSGVPSHRLDFTWFSFFDRHYAYLITFLGAIYPYADG